MPARQVQLDLVAASDLSPMVRSLVLEPAGGRPFEWQPGQHVEIVRPDDPASKLPMSIANAMDPERPGRLELAVTHSSSTRALCELPVGSVLTAFGPRGSFVRQAGSAHPALFVGAGTGLSPLKAMLEAELRTDSSAPLVVLFGCRTEADILWGEELYRLDRDEPRFSFVPTLSLASEGWTGRRGRVQAHLPELASVLSAPEAWLCGHHDMVQDCVKLLEHDLGVPRSKIYLEEY
jgi:NAD(P)H-flavin reductase